MCNDKHLNGQERWAGPGDSFGYRNTPAGQGTCPRDRVEDLSPNLSHGVIPKLSPLLEGVGERCVSQLNSKPRRLHTQRAGNKKELGSPGVCKEAQQCPCPTPAHTETSVIHLLTHSLIHSIEALALLLPGCVTWRE